MSAYQLRSITHFSAFYIKTCRIVHLQYSTDFLHYWLNYVIKSYHTNSWEYWMYKPFGSSHQPHFPDHCHWELLQHYCPDLFPQQSKTKTNLRNRIRNPRWAEGSIVCCVMRMDKENWISPRRWLETPLRSLCADGNWRILLDLSKLKKRITKRKLVKFYINFYLLRISFSLGHFLWCWSRFDMIGFHVELLQFWAQLFLIESVHVFWIGNLKY